MSTNEELIYKLKLDISDTEQKAKKLQQELGRLKLSPDLQKEAGKIFNGINQNLSNTKNLLDKGLIDKSSVSTLKASQKQLKDLASDAERLVATVTKSSNFKQFGKDLIPPELAQRVKDISKEIENLKKSVKSIDTSQLQNALANTGFKSSKNVERIKSDLLPALNTGDYEKALQIIQEVKSSLSQVFNTAKSPNNVANAQALIQPLTVLEQELTQSTQKGEDLKVKLSEAKTEVENINSSNVEKIKTAFEEASGSVEKLSENSGKLSDNISRTSQRMDELKSRLAYFTSMAFIIRKVSQSVREVVNNMKELDKSMTETAVVTNTTISQLWSLLPEYTKRANDLGVAIKEVYESMTLYRQQGLSAAQATQLSTATLKMARIAGLDASEAVDRMTNALRGFNQELGQTSAENVADVYSKLAAITASNVDELSTAMTKTASIASSAGMTFENTAAFLAQIIETTRESAETAGTALKTIIARFEELKKSPDEIGEIDGEIVDANKVETALRTVGIALRDTQGQFRNLDSVFIELAGKWDSLDKNTQRYIATMAAGSRLNVNRLLLAA